MTTKDEEYKQSIQEYEQNIVTMKNFIEACRNNPAHIIGYEKDPRAHLSCFREVLQNGIDEIIRPYSPANYISVEYYEKDGQAFKLRAAGRHAFQPDGFQCICNRER